MLVLAALVLASGIWIVDKIDETAAWLLAFLLLLTLAFSYKTFSDELTGLLSTQASQ
jgi:hypothetical protein